MNSEKNPETTQPKNEAQIAAQENRMYPQAALYSSLAKAQGSIPEIHKDREVSVKTKAGYTYKFKYATFGQIIKQIRKPLTENGIWFTQTLHHSPKTSSVDTSISAASGERVLRTTIIHKDGGEIHGDIPVIFSGGSNQEFGSALTYAKRYGLSSIFGIAADEDDDANMADGNTIQDKKERPQTTQKDPPQEPRRTSAQQSKVDTQVKYKTWAKKVAAAVRKAVTDEMIDEIIGAAGELTNIKRAEIQAPEICRQIKSYITLRRKQIADAATKENPDAEPANA